MSFPSTPLDLRCELDLSGWTDVSSYVYQRGGVPSLTRGRADETAHATGGKASWEWDNRSGDFSPKNPSSPYYGLLKRNTPVRWSIPAQQNYLRLEADNADRAYVNENASLDITGSLEARIFLRLTDWRACVLAAKWDGGGCWRWRLNGDGTMVLDWYDASAAYHSATSSAPLPFTSADTALRVTFDTSTGTATFFTSDSIDGTWTQVGDAVSGTAGAATTVGTGNSALVVGWSANFSGQLLGRVYEFRLLDGIGGTVAADGVFSAQAAGAASWTDSAGNLWQLAGGAEVSDRNYRWHGEMSSQPPRWDNSGTDMSVTATAGGPLRRLTQGSQPPVTSPMTRGLLSQSGTLACVALWPCEDAAGASALGSAVGGPLMTFSGSPKLASDSSFAAAAPLPVLNGSTWRGAVPGYSGSGSIVVRFLAKLGTLPSSGYVTVLRAETTGTVTTIYVVAYAGGTLGVIGYDAYGNTVVNSGPVAMNDPTTPLWYSLEIRPSGTSVTCYLVTLPPGSTVGQEWSTTVASSSVGNCTVVRPNPNGALTDTVLGMISVQADWESLFNLSGPLMAWDGETAANRFARLAGENGYEARIIGSPDVSAAMGEQPSGSLMTLLQQCEDADRGLIFEPRQALALGYRTLASMLNQSPAVTLDYSASQAGGANGGSGDSGLDPTYDDLLTRNDWTLTRGTPSSSGATVRESLDDGSDMSVSVVGDYADSLTVYVQEDSQLSNLAMWMVHTGTVDEARWPVIPENLARGAVSALYYDICDADVGDFIQLGNVPGTVTADPVKQLVYGTSEQLGGFVHEMSWNAVPESPYEVIVLDDDVYGRVDTDGSTLHAAYTYGDATLTVDTASGYPLWTTDAADFPFDVGVSGMRLTVTGISGTSGTQTFAVTPGVNGVSKNLPAGADVRLWSPPILSLT